MNKFCRKGLSLALMCTLSSGLVGGNNVACAKWGEGETFDVIIFDKGVEKKITTHVDSWLSRSLLKGGLSVRFDEPFIGAELYRKAYRGKGLIKEEFKSNESIDELTDRLRTIRKEVANCNDSRKIQKLEQEYRLKSKLLADKVIDAYEDENRFKEIKGLFCALIPLLLLPFADRIFDRGNTEANYEVSDRKNAGTNGEVSNISSSN